MLLKHLYDFAVSRKLLEDPAFKRCQPVRWIIHLDPSGKLLGQGPQETTGPRRNKGHEYEVPKTTRATYSGMVADFLVDDIGAIFRLTADPSKRPNERAATNLTAKHEDYWQQIRNAHAATRDPRFAALLAFHESLAGNAPTFLRLNTKGTGWTITTSNDGEVPLGSDMLTFAVGVPLFLDDSIRGYWRTVHAKEATDAEGAAEIGMCLVTGQSGVALARTHTPMVTGLPKTDKRDRTRQRGIVGFEADSFRSYGFEKSYNAPTSITASCGYLLALQHLSRSQNHWLPLGSAWLCFWAAQSEEATNIFARLFRQPDPLTVRKFFASPWSGLKKPPPSTDNFIAVTLTAAGPRIVVKAWVQMPLATAVANLETWFTDLRVDSGSGESTDEMVAKEDSFPPLAVKRLAGCTTPLTKKGSRLVPDLEKLRPDVVAQLYRAALEGTAPSLALLKPLLDQLHSLICREKGFRMVPDDESRFALLRLIINRHHRFNNETHMEIPPKQSPETGITDAAYNCGCLLSVFNSLQRSAHKAGDPQRELNTTIAERYFSSASSNPNAAFSILWRLHQHHLKKLRQGGTKGEKAAHRIKETITEICARFREPAAGVCPDFPRFFTLVEQGRFALGYYQQEAKRIAAIRAWREKLAAEGKLAADEETAEDEILSQQ